MDQRSHDVRKARCSRNRHRRSRFRSSELLRVNQDCTQQPLLDRMRLALRRWQARDRMRQAPGRTLKPPDRRRLQRLLDRMPWRCRQMLQLFDWQTDRK